MSMKIRRQKSKNRFLYIFVNNNIYFFLFALTIAKYSSPSMVELKAGNWDYKKDRSVSMLVLMHTIKLAKTANNVRHSTTK